MYMFIKSIYIYTHTYIYTYIYIYIHTHTHTHTHTYSQTDRQTNRHIYTASDSLGCGIEAYFNLTVWGGGVGNKHTIEYI
jgi:hypothetical protein